MKYKRHIATGVLALSLLIGGSPVFATTPQDLGIKNVQVVSQKQNKNLKTKKSGSNSIVGIISAINDNGFTVGIKNLKTKTTSSIDVQINSTTKFSKNGVKALMSDLILGQKVIVVGTLDKTTNILLAKKVKIVNN